MDHLYDADGNVTWWYLARLSSEAFAGNDPDLLDRLERGSRLVREGVARSRRECGLPPTQKAAGPHEGHSVGKDEAGVEVCWTCSRREGA